jgi:Ca2+-transporting ATPase
MNRTMLETLFIGALSLFVAVSTTFLATWYLNANLPLDQRTTLAQTVAFATWMLGHIFLALNFRSEKEPLTKLGILSNKLMILWAVVVFVTLLFGTSLPFVHDSLKITNLSLSNWAFVVSVAFLATFWMELKKQLKP